MINHSTSNKDFLYQLQKGRNGIFGLFSLPSYNNFISVHFISDIRETFQQELRETHKNDFYIISLITNGRGVYNIDDERIMVEKGSILLLHSGQYCSIVEETDIEGIRIAFSPHIFDNMTRNIANVVKYTLFRNFNIIRIESRDFHEYIEECFSMLLVESKTNIHSFMYNPRLYSMLYYTITKIYEYQPNVNNGVTSKTLELFIRFSAMIDDRYKTMHSVTEYRTALNVSHKLLTECAREHANKSPLDMIMEKTVFEAKKLLNYTNLSIKEIALELGYREPSNFSTLFKKHTKVSPNQYRERNSNKLSSDAQKY